jgi:hypothetical protein
MLGVIFVVTGLAFPILRVSRSIRPRRIGSFPTFSRARKWAFFGLC